MDTLKALNNECGVLVGAVLLADGEISQGESAAASLIANEQILGGAKEYITAHANGNGLIRFCRACEFFSAFYLLDPKSAAAAAHATMNLLTKIAEVGGVDEREECVLFVVARVLRVENELKATANLLQRLVAQFQSG